jgi:hypothetical protein
MTSEEISFLSYTVSHFQEVARQNRFAENSSIEHERERCVICHPGLLPMEPFAIYLEVVTESVKVRRPRLDQTLVDQINDDLLLSGHSGFVSLESLLSGEIQARRNALSTGLQLLSIHSPTSHEFDLDEAEEERFGELILDKIEDLMAYQKKNA